MGTVLRKGGMKYSPNMAFAFTKFKPKFDVLTNFSELPDLEFSENVVRSNETFTL
jgi:hypothetical protein